MYGSSSSIYGCENWIVTEGILQQLQLEAVLGELAKRALRWPKHHYSLQYSRSHYLRDELSEVPIAGQETRVLEEDGEGWCYWSRCSCYEVNGGQCCFFVSGQGM